MRRLHLWRAKTRGEALGPEPMKVETQSAIAEVVQRDINSVNAVEVAGVSNSVMASVELGLPPEPDNSINPVSPSPQNATLDRSPGVDPCDVGPAPHYREWHRRALGLATIHPHKGLHTWGPDLQLAEDKPLSDAIDSKCVPARFATAELIAACMVSTQKHRLKESIAKPVGVGRAGHDAAWARQQAQSQLDHASAAEAMTYERLRMAHEDLLSSWYGEQCADEAQKLEAVRQEELATATFHAVKLQAQFRGWCARCRCAIKRRAQMQLWQEIRKKKQEDQRLKDFQEVEAKRARSSILNTEPSKEAKRMQKIANICDAYALREDLYIDDTGSDWEPDGAIGSAAEQGLQGRLPMDAPFASPQQREVRMEDQQKISQAEEVHDDALGSTADFSLGETSNPLSPSFSLSGASPQKPFSSESPEHLQLSPYLRKARLAAEDERIRRLQEQARSARKAQGKVRALERAGAYTKRESQFGSDDQPSIKLTQSIKFTQSEEAVVLLRTAFAKQIDKHNLGSTRNLEVDVAEQVRSKYLECCELWNAKPNSQVLTSLQNARPTWADDGIEIGYNFENAHLGDRGGVCLLNALALDPRISSLSLRSCCLRGGCGPVIALFIELHPKLREIDLSRNSLSYEFGELLLEALDRRAHSRRTKSKHKGISAARTAVLAPADVSPPSKANAPLPRSDSKMPVSRAASKMPPTVDASVLRSPSKATGVVSMGEVTINLEGTWFSWDRAEGYTVSPPCGTLWAGLSDNRSKLAPSGYEKLRKRLDNTELVQYKKIPPEGWLPSVKA